MQIAVVGGHGQIARLLHPLLVAAGHVPIALVRSDEQRAAVEALGARARLLDIERSEVNGFVEAFTDCDAVVFAAGGGPDGNIERKQTVDLGGALKSIEAARAIGIRRFVQVSAIGVDEPGAANAGEVWTAYVEAKRDADAALSGTDLGWTILRPGRLTDDEPTGLVALGPDVSRGSVTRADVAAVLATVLDRDDTAGHEWNLVGGDVPPATASGMTEPILAPAGDTPRFVNAPTWR